MNNTKINNAKKGFALTLDLILGMVIVFSVVFVSLFFVSRGGEITIAEHQLARIGSDIVTVMDEQKVFDALDHAAIETRMEELLPANADMLIRIEGDFGIGNGTIEVGGDIPQERLIISVERAALTDDTIFLKITAFVWAREQ
ncbi:hypothetical protein HY497_01215 [Candidatus Woesearchaeota archaeon]|nr:hypothetical protein [Candidatus Woesearchaeota archaeon]